MSSVPAAFWGKARPDDGSQSPTHPLPAHALDVAAVASLVAVHPPIPIDSRTLSFLVALHDIGKFSRPFQAKIPDAWPTSVLGTYSDARRPPDLPHDLVGFALLSEIVAEQLEPVLPSDRGWASSDRECLWRALAGHHGRPPDPAKVHRVTDEVVCHGCREAVQAFVSSMRDVFNPPAWERPDRDLDVARFSWWLAGLTTLADWIGSRQSWFPYVSNRSACEPARYFSEVAQPRAVAALAASGVTASAPSSYEGLRGLFPTIMQPTPIQQWAEHAELPDGPSLTVIEDLTGSGKTEAALTLAHRLMAAGRARGVYMALPTMATANAMFGRLSDCYRQLFVADTKPSLALAHGRAKLDERFARTIDAGTAGACGAMDPADEPAESHCASWLVDDRRRTLLAQVGVGTLDQALLSILPVRHATLRLFGVADKVLIVDEAHAFDSYMREELATLLQFHAALGGSAILLSATLPHKLRTKLIAAFRIGLGVARSPRLTQTSYPLATIASAQGIVETPCAPRAGLPRRVTVTRLPDTAVAVERIRSAAALGAAVVWVRNTVDDAIAAAATLRACGIEPLLFHARFALTDRLKIEQEVLRRFGRDSTGEDRRCVLVATQVVEQSLDLDFDVMVTDLAPVDLLIQRAGRLWRHKRDAAARTVEGPELLVISPDPVRAPAKDWITALLPGTGAVYRDHALLWRSAQEVFRRGAIVTPDDMRPLIEEASQGDAPPALERSAADTQGKDSAKASIAKQNVLRLGDGYDINAGAWEPDTRTPTRLEDRPQVTLRLALHKDGAIVPYADDPEPSRAWAMSEVSVPQYRIATCLVPAGLEAKAIAAKAGWGRWERESLVVLLGLIEPADRSYTLTVRSDAGQDFVARYDDRQGLSWSNLIPAHAG